MSTYNLIHADFMNWLRGNQWQVQNGYMPKYHAVFADPPYGLEFMSKSWDKPVPSDAYIRDRSATPTPFARRAAPESYKAGIHYQEWVTEWASMLLDFVYPGAVLAMFGGTRTYHRLTAGLEDAGWEVFDCAMYMYGSGFPKSLAIDKALDKEAGAQREIIGRSTNGSGINHTKIANHGKGDTGLGTWDGSGKEFDITSPATELAQAWHGYGTSLKPSFEPLVLARAPRGKHTYAALAREFGTGALNIDGCRIDADNRPLRIPGTKSGFGDVGVSAGSVAAGLTSEGRWPANTVLVCACESDIHAADCPVALLDAQSGVTKSQQGHRDPNGSMGYHGGASGTPFRLDGYQDEGGASRFYYTAKASSAEREMGLSKRCTHPTVKPLTLNEYFCRLLLPPPLSEPRRVLIPFAGVGSEVIGAMLAGFDIVTGIEREHEYIAQARERVAWWSQFKTYEQAETAYGVGKRKTEQEQQTGQLPLFPAA